MNDTLKCGFCQRPWEECEAEICPERTIVKSYQELLGVRSDPIQEDPSMNDPIEYLSWIVASAESGRWHLSGRDVFAIATAVERLKKLEAKERGET